MSEPRFQYFSPMLFPMFPEPSGRLVLEVDIQHMLDKCIADRASDAELAVGFETFAAGASLCRDELKITVTKGKADQPRLIRELASERPGYLEMTIFADRPLLKKVYVGDDYVLWVRPGQGTISFGGEAKYALDRVIEQIRTHGRFCLVHSAAYIDPERGIDNSFMLMNPYDQKITARMVSSGGRKMAAQIAPRSVKVVGLEPILRPGEWETVMLTANNRLPVYDLRHRTGDPSSLYSLDHLDTYSGYPTHQSVRIVPFARDKVRRWLRDLGLRYR